jgi:hypothetical protein
MTTKKVRLALALLLYVLCFTMGCLGSSPNEEECPQIEAREESPEWMQSLGKLQSQFGLRPDEHAIVVDISEQRLYLAKDETIVKMYPVSTSKYGIGNREGSNKTPLGTHCISKKIGEDAEIGAIFKDCINTGEIAEIYTDSTDAPVDFVTTRIMWLEGLEPGINSGESIDSLELGCFNPVGLIISLQRETISLFYSFDQSATFRVCLLFLG